MIQIAETVLPLLDHFERAFSAPRGTRSEGEFRASPSPGPCHDARFQLVMSSNPLIKEMTMTPRLNASPPRRPP